MIAEDEAWQAVLARDRGSDGRFVFGVASTGIYCRPSCPARHAHVRQVTFFRDGDEARAAGLRSCLRCRPDDVRRDHEAVLAAIIAIKAADKPLPLAQLAYLAGYSPAHIQRLFTRATGLSPSAYARALRIERAQQALSDVGSVTESLYEAGYAAPSRFYADASARLGMTPSAWAQGGRGVAIRWAVVATSLGPMLIASTPKGVCRLSFNEGREHLVARFPNAELVEGDADFGQLLAQVVAAVEHPGQGATIPLDVRGTAFQEAVWRELARIPSGETRSYAQIAAAIGKPGAVRAAGSANGANPVAVLVPCHRVVRSDGTLGGYAYGLKIKAELLKRENVHDTNPSRRT